MVVVIVGESGSGKSTLQKYYINKSGNFKKPVMTTSRPIRNGEANGSDYWFVERQTFEDMIKNENLITYSEYRGWYYGISVNEIAKLLANNNDIFMVLTPSDMRNMKSLLNKYLADDEIFTFYLKVDRVSRLCKLVTTRDDTDECIRRNISDCGMFDGIENEVDYVINNECYKKPVSEIADEIENFISTRK